MALAKQPSNGRVQKPPPKVPPVKSHVQAKHLQGARAVNRAYGAGPVTVYTPNAKLARATKAAIRRTNTQTGMPVFQYVNKKSNADVVVKITPKAQNAATGVMGGSNTASGRGKVRVAPNIAKQFTRKENAGLLQHELGHTIGLGHPGPAKNPYMYRYKPYNGETLGMPNHKSGIMGSGNRETTSEAKEIRTLRAVANRDHHQHAATTSSQMVPARFRLS